MYTRTPSRTSTTTTTTTVTVLRENSIPGQLSSDPQPRALAAFLRSTSQDSTNELGPCV